MKMAQFFQWTNEISVGIQEIDEQHKQLVNLLNQLFDAMVSDDSNREAIALKTLDELINYTNVHFAVEESLFRIFDYEDYDRHKKAHDRLKDEVNEIALSVKSGATRLDSKLLIFMKNWLTSHIMEEDKRYSKFLLARGVRKDWAQKSWLGKLWG
jgi:hemerythrin